MILNFITAFTILNSKTFICHSLLKMILVEIEASTRKYKQKYSPKLKSVPEFKGKLKDYISIQLRLIYLTLNMNLLEDWILPDQFSSYHARCSFVANN